MLCNVIQGSDMYLTAKVRLFEAISIHHSNQIFKHTVKHLMKLIPSHRQWLLGGQRSSVEFHLKREPNQKTVQLK